MDRRPQCDFFSLLDKLIKETFYGRIHREQEVGCNFRSPSLTRSSLRSPPLLGCHSEQVSVREGVCGVGDGARVTVYLHHCLSLRSKPRCLEGK